MTDTRIKIAGKHWAEAVRQLGGHSNLAICNKAIEIALAEQSAQPEQYITAEQARELGAGAEFFMPESGYWAHCGNLENFPSTFEDGETIKYRAIKQAQPEPVDPHADLRAEYAKQVADGTTGFYLWEFGGNGLTWIKCDAAPSFIPVYEYRCTDISCMVAAKGEPAKRMLRTEAQELQRSLGDTVEWFNPYNDRLTFESDFGLAGTYTYAPKATIKLDGNTVTRDQAVAEWESKKETCDLHYFHPNCGWINHNIVIGDVFADTSPDTRYSIRPKLAKIVKWSDMPQFVKVRHKSTKQTFTFLGVDTFGYLVVFRRDCDDHSYNPPALELAPASEQPWMYWGGGECPVPEGCTFEVTFRDSTVGDTHHIDGIDYYWTHKGNSGDIIAYRITGIAKGHVLGGAV